MAQLTLMADADGIKFQAGFATDIGGGRENQDEGFIWMRKEDRLVVLGVLDGHGREVGRTAAVAAKTCLLELLDSEYEQLIKSPVEFLVHAHQKAHENIKHMFTLEFERQGYQVKLTDEGYLLKRRSSHDNWSCVHGGAACTLLAIVGDQLYCANVGDSTALLCAPFPIFTPQSLCLMRDAAVMECSRSTDSFSNESSRQLILTAEHSPESSYEYQRLRAFRSRDDDPMQPALYVVYDSASHDKSQCSPVFDSRQPQLSASQRGSYFKNVRKEWASLVSTPITAVFQDALAFTRSLGDLHLHTYGVTHMPEVHRVDLGPLFTILRTHDSNHKESATLPSDGVASRMNQTLCVVVATDGVWDNWLYEDVVKFVMDESCLRATNAAPEGAQRVTTSFMNRNAIFARRNFGNQADNATGIVMYISLSADFPA